MRSPLILVAVASVLVSACSTTPPARSTYLLRSSHNMESGPLAKVGQETLGELKVANYIDQYSQRLAIATGRNMADSNSRTLPPSPTAGPEYSSTFPKQTACPITHNGIV